MAYTGTTAAILSNYDEALKTFYLPAVQEQLNHETFLADKLEVNEEDVSGTDATIDCHYGRSSGTGARADGGALPDADYQKFKQCIVPTRYQYGRVTFSGPTIAATRDEKGAYARVIDTEITGIVKDLAQEVNRQMWGCGYGVLARWLSGTGTAPYVQKKYMGNAVGGDGFGSTFGGKYFQENPVGTTYLDSSQSGSHMDVMTVSTTKLTVTAITEGTTSDLLTMTDSGVSESAGTYYVRLGNVRTLAASSVAGYARLEMMGLRGIVTDENPDDIALFDGATDYDTNRGHNVADPLQGLDVDSYSWWKSQVDASSAGRYRAQRALSRKLMQKMFDKVEKAAGVGYGPDTIMTTRAIRREYFELVVPDVRHVNTMELDGGWEALDYNGVPLMVDDDAIDGEMYFLTLKDLQVYRMSDYDWMNKDGNILSRITGYDAYEAVLYRYAELGCKRRNSQGVLCDLSYEAD
uniref:Putative capsid protein n=1 Tax=viral metagenome TaxID=1070528 RepID=A0A6M3LAD7_9ZZZZ